MTSNDLGIFQRSRLLHRLEVIWVRWSRCWLLPPKSNERQCRKQPWTGWWFQIFSMFTIFHPYLGKIPILTNIFQMSWNHQLVNEDVWIYESWWFSIAMLLFGRVIFQETCSIGWLKWNHLDSQEFGVTRYKQLAKYKSDISQTYRLTRWKCQPQISFNSLFFPYAPIPSAVVVLEWVLGT